ncbi:MAG: efflux RND transporter periplasmic adaptor subunit [Phycisphaeraceae bacterium]|nr:efflux RND transporter periplasmic adaptor subunit [Phycisphaeraceae bacterium]MCW5754186.1 efflux RND transporter periplasmic adaptor subunit [Phycisphaeraceae bacterium]
MSDGFWSMARRFNIIISIFAVFVPATVSLAQPSGGLREAQVRVDPARMEHVSLQREVTGDVRTPRRSRLAAQEEGLVLQCELQPGDVVLRNDIIAVLDSEPAEIAVRQARAESRARAGLLAQRQAELEQAERDLNRYNELDRRFSASEGELDRARTLVATLTAQVEQAQADLDAATARVDDAVRRLNRMTIRAPFSGKVVRKLTDQGQWLRQGDDIIEIVALETMEVWLNVPETAIEHLRQPGAAIVVRIDALRVPDPRDASRTLPAELTVPVTAVVPEVDPLSRLAPVRAELPNPDGRLTPGMSIVGLVPIGVRQMRMTIHKDAVLRDDAGEYIFVNIDGQAVPMRIRSRFGFADRVAIDDGVVFPGAQIVIEGNERLIPGQPLRILNPPEAPRPAASFLDMHDSREPHASVSTVPSEASR